MHDRIDAVFREYLRQDMLVADIPEIEAGGGRDGPAEAGGQAVENDDLFAGIQQCPHHVTADIAGTTGHENGHVQAPCLSSIRKRRAACLLPPRRRSYQSLRI